MTNCTVTRLLTRDAEGGPEVVGVCYSKGGAEVGHPKCNCFAIDCVYLYFILLKWPHRPPCVLTVSSSPLEGLPVITPTALCSPSLPQCKWGARRNKCDGAPRIKRQFFFFWREFTGIMSAPCEDHEFLPPTTVIFANTARDTLGQLPSFPPPMALTPPETASKWAASSEPTSSTWTRFRYDGVWAYLRQYRWYIENFFF